MKKVHEALLLHYLEHHSGYSNSHGLNHRTAREMRNDARILVKQIWPKSDEAKRIDEFRITSPDYD